MMKILMIDQGNTRNKYAVLDASTIKIINEASLSDEIFDYVLIASVKNDLEIIESSKRFVSNPLNVFSIKTQKDYLGLTVGYEDHTRLGVDRWLAMLGAHEVNQYSLIVDAGTALTIDAIDASGQHLGGWIIPGFATSEKALLAKTDSINIKEKINKTLHFGLSTEQCVNNGIFLSLLLPIKQALNLLQQPNKKIKCYFTGGDGALLANEIIKTNEKNIEVITDDTLIFKGLLRYFDQEMHKK